MSNDPERPRGSRLARLLAVALAARIARGRPPEHSDADRRDTTGADDPARREVPGNPRVERLVAGLLLAAGLTGFGFTAIYVLAGENTQLLGLAFGASLGLLAVACIVAGKAVVPQVTSVEDRGALLDEKESEDVVEMIEQGGEGISRRGLLAGAGGIAGAGLITAAATPLASLGPKLSGIHDTAWRAGVRLVDDRGRPYLADEIAIGAFYTALPEGGDPDHFSAGLLVVKLPATMIHLPARRDGWAPRGILAYSKICPHAGCAISLYRYPTYAPTSTEPAFTCPCHYSTFLPGQAGRLVFGPAGRSLPQLPLAIDQSGYLRAAGAFQQDIGPSWWSVRR